METVNVHDAKTRLSQLLSRVEQGEEFVIARAGKPLAKLSPITPAAVPRTLGLLNGKIRIPDDFDAPLPDDVLDAFEGRLPPR